MMDFITDLPISNGFDSIFIVVNQGLSKQVILCPCNKMIDAEGTIKLYIGNVFIQYGFPDVIISDRGPQFASNVFNGVFDAIGVKHRMSTAYHPQTDGQTECYNQELEAYLRIYCAYKPDKWSNKLSLAQFAHNARTHEAIRLDLLRRILAADVERLYDAAIDDVCANQYGVIPKNENPMDLICMKYTHPLTTIAPDRSHTIELINNVQDKTNDLAYYINKLSNLTETIQRNTKWTKKVYLGGAKPQTLSGEVIFNIEHFIADVENDYHGDCMTPYRRHAANPRRCIHCQGTHASEDHHLSLTVPIVSNSGYPVLLPIQEQIETSANNDTPHSYKKTRFSLPSQQFTFATYQKQQWPLPP
jgi:hypothetical protein